jgi:hypothetical protein
MVGESIIKLTYGLDVKEENDPYIDCFEQAILSLSQAGTPGAFLVDTFPFLKHVPKWVPGAGFQRKAEEWKKISQYMLELPFRDSKKNIVRGSCFPRFSVETS